MNGRAMELEAEINHDRIQFARADVVDYASMLQAFKAAVEFSPKKSIDIVIPCAGLFGPPINALLPDPSSPGLFDLI
jgi:5'-hydroxyaverantin dehydrogenase